MRFAKLLSALIIVVLIAGTAQAQIYAGVQGGVGFSSFEEQSSGATAVPLGITVGTDILPIIDVGAEAIFLVSPYKFEIDDPFSTNKTEVEINQTIIGAYARWYVLPLPALSPYLRGGLAYYTGKTKTEAGDLDLKGTIGFNIGAGVDLLMGLYGEVVFHIVSQEADIQNASSLGYNSVQVQLGYSFDLL